MNHKKQVFYALVLTGIWLIALTGCGVKTNMLNNSYSVSPNPLEVRGDSITINISASVPANSVNPKANIRFQPYFKSNKGEIPLRAVTIGGEAVTESVDMKVNSKTGGRLTYTEKIPYNDDLRRVTLYPDFALKIKGNYVSVPQAKGGKVLAEGTNTTVKLVMNTPGSMMYDVTDYATTTSSRMVNTYFPIDVSKFNPSFKVKGLFDNKKQIDSLKKVLKADKNWVVKGVSINAFASPDGELSRNEGLAKARSESTISYFKKELKKLGFSEVNDQNFKVGFTLAEDWAGYTKNVSASIHPDKQGVLAILNDRGVSDDDREARIKASFPKFWESTKGSLLSPLRRSELVVNGQTPLKGDQELIGYMDKLDALTDVELLHLGSVLTDPAQREKVYITQVSKSTQDWKGFNDLGAVQLQLGKKQEGSDNLTKANELSPENPAILVNMCNVALMDQDYVKAADILSRAAAKGADVSYGMGILAIRKGNYADAVGLMNKSGKKDFNVALAQLLNGDANTAKSILDNMNPEEMTWQCYYLRAIIGARANDLDMLTTNLTRAVQKSSECRSKSKEDIEFMKFWTNPAFEAAIR